MLCSSRMSTPDHTPPRSWREGRRLRAGELHQQGWTQQQIARALGVTQGAVSQWLRRTAVRGRAALHDHPAPGAPPLLTTDQHAQLVALLLEGAPAFGFRGDVWTCRRVAQLIQDQFGVRYHPAHISRLLRQLGWSRKNPSCARPSAMTPPLRLGTPNAGRRLKKVPARRANIVWVDEAGFYLLAGAVRSYAPRGETPVLRVPLTRDHLSVISGITAAGQLLVAVQARAFKGRDVVRFLQHLWGHLGGGC